MGSRERSGETASALGSDGARGGAALGVVMGAALVFEGGFDGSAAGERSLQPASVHAPKANKKPSFASDLIHGTLARPDIACAVRGALTRFTSAKGRDAARVDQLWLRAVSG